MAFPGGAALLDERRQRVHLCNETSAAMWRLLAQGLPEHDVVETLAEHYRIAPRVVADDLAVALSDWTELGLLGDDRDLGSPLSAPRHDWPRGGEPRSQNYALAGFAFELRGAEARIMDHLEATLETFRADNAGGRTRLEIRTDSSGEPFVLLEDGVERLRTARTREMIGAVFQALLEKHVPAAEWLALIHGAAIATADGRAVILPGEGGSGKSTLAAWLSRRGFGFLADDTVALDAPHGRVVAWPLPHSIKRGSWADLAVAMPELAALPSRIVVGREMKFVPAPDDAWTAPPAPVAALVFPRYDTRAEPRLNRLSLLETIERLFAGRIWLGEELTRERVEAFIRWLEPIPSYEARYAALPEAEDFVRRVVD
jgi:hypothetical protein